MIPFSVPDVCWCQPFDGPIHPNCPMHGEETSERKVLKKHPKAEVFAIPISRSTTAYRIGIKRGPRAKIWLSSFCATPESAWEQAFTASQGGHERRGS